MLRAGGLFGRRTGKRFRESSSSSDESDSLKIHLVEIIHKKSLRDLYVLNENFEVVEVNGDIGLSVGDHVVCYMGVDLRGKPYEAYKNAKLSISAISPFGKVTLQVLRRNSDPKCLQPSFPLFSKPKQTQIFCWECSKTVYLETLRDYGWSVKHILTCQGIELQPEQHESDPKEDQNFEIKPSPKRLNASLFSPTSKLTITLGNMLVKWNEYSVPKGRKKIVTPQFIEEVLAKIGIPIVEFDQNLDPVNFKLYQDVVDTLRRRFKHILDEKKKAGSIEKAGLDFEEVLFNLEDKPTLIDMDCYVPQSQPDSQGSDFTIRSSQFSNIEEEIPFPEPDPDPEPDPQPKSKTTASTSKRKDFDKLTDDWIRTKMNQLFNGVQEFCETNEIDHTIAICRLGRRFNYVHNRKLANTFKEIEKGNFTLPLTMPMEDAVYVKSRFIPTQRKWTNYKIFHSDYVSVPPYAKLSQYIHKIIPTKIKFENGFRLPLRTVAQETLERLPDKVSQTFDLLIH